MPGDGFDGDSAPRRGHVDSIRMLSRILRTRRSPSPYLLVRIMRTRHLACLLLVLSSVPVAAEDRPLSAPDIMMRVAANQDSAQKLRAEYVYQQRVRVATHRTNGKLAREETAEYLVTPTADGIKKELKKIEGRYWYKGKYLEFHKEPVPDRHSLDGDLVDDFRHDAVDNESKDGIARDLFPLTTKEQRQYSFTLAGEEAFRGRKVYRIRFRPADKDDYTWTGEAVIDAGEFEPVTVFTRLSRRIPLAVRTLLGTDLPGLGFNVEYRRFEEGIWFPVSFGTEFRLHVLFFLNRVITVSVENSAFERAKVDTKILGFEPTQ